MTADVTPSDYAWPAGDIRRYGAEVGGGDCSSAIQASMDQAIVEGGSDVYVPPGEWTVTANVAAGGALTVWGYGATLYCDESIEIMSLTTGCRVFGLTFEGSTPDQSDGGYAIRALGERVSWPSREGVGHHHPGLQVLLAPEHRGLV